MNTNNITIVDCKSKKQNYCRLQICQLKYSHFDWKIDKGLHYMLNNSKTNDEVFSMLNIAKQASVDLVIFPELSIPQNLIPKVQQWSLQNNCIVVCGSHYHTNNNLTISSSAIIINGDVYFTDKICPSPYEISPIQGEGLSNGNELLKFKNTQIGNLGILICSDYLDNTVKHIYDINDLDILCVPSFQGNSNMYYNRMNIDCSDSQDGVYIAYSNFLEPGYGDGNSALFGIVDRIFSDKMKAGGFTDLRPENKIFQFQNDTQYAIFELDLNNKRPFINRNITTYPNIVLLSQTSENNIKGTRFIEKIAHDDERYKRIDELFVPPNEYDEIVKTLEENNLIFIVGDPGIGKTYTAVKLLKEYFNKGYYPIWVSGLDKEERDNQSKLLRDFQPTDNQIVYFEDPFGRTSFEKRDVIYEIFKPLSENLKQYNCKVIVTSRKEIFEKFTQESLLDEDLLVLKKELNVTNPSYDSNKLSQIYKQLASNFTSWYPNADFNEVIIDAINKGKITTPLAIRDLIYSTRDTKELLELKDKIQKRGISIAKAFALEILGLPIATKIALYLIFVSGSFGQKKLNAAFDDINNTLGENKTESFNTTLRTQLGYRVEKFGVYTPFYRLSHPIYEEALNKLADSNNEAKTLLKAIISHYIKIDIRDSFRIVTKLVNKHPSMALMLFEHLLENGHNIDDEDLKIVLVRKLISIYFTTKNTKFFDLANYFYPLEKVVNDINSSNNAKKLPQKLNIIQRYINNSPTEFNYSYYNKIDWEKIFSLRLSHYYGINLMLEILYSTYDIDKEAVTIFLKYNSITYLKRMYYWMDDWQRNKLIKVLGSQQNSESIINSIKDSNHTFNDEEHKDDVHLKKNNQELKRQLFSDKKYYGYVTIDDGAEFVLRKKWWLNLLPVGIISVHGQFDAGSIIAIKNSKKQVIGMGMSDYSSSELNHIIGHPSNEIPHILGYYYGPMAIRSNNRILFKYPNQLRGWEYIK